jgi:hypothetical protein
MTGVELGVGAYRVGDRYVVRELGVQRLGDPFGRRPSLGIDAGDLSQRMDAGVGPPGYGEAVPAREDAVKSLAEGPFDRPEPRLPRPAPETRAVVLER